MKLKSVYLYCVAGGHHILLQQKATTFQRSHRLLTDRGHHDSLCPLATAAHHFKSQDRIMSLCCCDRRRAATAAATTAAADPAPFPAICDV